MKPLAALLLAATFAAAYARGQQTLADALRWDLKLLDAAPESRHCTAIAMFEATSELILYGGLANSTQFPETWAFDGTRWSQKKPAHNPPAMYCHAMAYDPKRKQIVMLGRLNKDKWETTTWLWNGTDWSEAKPTTKPRFHSNAAMAYNYATGRMMLFGGINADSSVWEWDGESWLKIAADSSPPPRGYAGLAFDQERNEMVMFGGITNPYSPKPLIYDDTWAWNGKTWRQIITPIQPSSRYGHKMEYHPILKKIILVGGQKGKRDEGPGPEGLFSDTWAWNGATWVQYGGKDSIQPAYSYGMGYSSVTREFYLYLGDSLKCATRGPKVFILKQ